MCLTVGHHVVMKQDGNHVYGLCMRCGMRTTGWTYGESPAKVEGSQSYWDALYSEVMDTELALHGGG